MAIKQVPTCAIQCTMEPGTDQKASHTKTSCCVCGRPATRMFCTIGKDYVVHAMLFCEACSWYDVQDRKIILL